MACWATLALVPEDSLIGSVGQKNTVEAGNRGRSQQVRAATGILADRGNSLPSHDVGIAIPQYLGFLGRRSCGLAAARIRKRGPMDGFSRGQ